MISSAYILWSFEPIGSFLSFVFSPTMAVFLFLLSKYLYYSIYTLSHDTLSHMSTRTSLFVLYGSCFFLCPTASQNKTIIPSTGIGRGFTHQGQRMGTEMLKMRKGLPSRSIKDNKNLVLQKLIPGSTTPLFTVLKNRCLLLHPCV